MVAVVQADKRWLLQNRVKSISSTEATIIVGTPNNTDFEATVQLANLTNHYSQVTK